MSGQGIIRTARRPPGWVAPGPRPPEPGSFPDGWPRQGEDLCFLSGDWRILQRVDGHRWSLDDLVTGWTAARAVSGPPPLAVDLGCGIGTVLLLTAWSFPAARCVGVEAQTVSVGLARRSLGWNGATDRCAVREGDFRDAALTADLAGSAMLVTGTPPYFPRGTGMESTGVQRGPCRFEHRGGVEAYTEAAARLLAPGGRFVGCLATLQADRIPDAAAASGLAVVSMRDVIPREGKQALVTVFTLARASEHGDEARRVAPLVVRDAGGAWTPEFRTVRGDMGMPA